MKKGLKTGLITAGILAAAGGVLCIAGAALGADFDRMASEGRFSIDEYELERYFERHDDGEASRNTRTDTGNGQKLAGDMQEFDGIRELEIDVADRNVIIQEYGQKTVSVAVLGGGDVRVYEEAGELKIESRKKRKHRSGTEEKDIIVMLPEGTKLQSLDCSIGAGELYAKLLRAGEADLEVGAGQIIVDDMEAQDIQMGCQAGKLVVKGRDFVKAELECEVGDIEFTAIGRAEDYAYSVECAVGKVQIGGESYSGIFNTHLGNKGADRRIEVECSVGNVEVDFAGGL